MTLLPADLQTHWVPLAPIFALHSEADYDSAVARLNALVDEVGSNEQHPLYGLLDTLGAVIHAYELQQHAIPDVPGHEVLQHLLEEHDLSAAELTELGSVAEAEQVLSGKRPLTPDQIRALAARFGVSPAALL
ncbi:MAG: type II toxin-antitoxin system HigA family antitoxin [Pirellulales bacterium]